LTGLWRETTGQFGDRDKPYQNENYWGEEKRGKEGVERLAREWLVSEGAQRGNSRALQRGLKTVLFLCKKGKVQCVKKKGNRGPEPDGGRNNGASEGGREGRGGGKHLQHKHRRTHPTGDPSQNGKGYLNKGSHWESQKNQTHQ